MTATARTKHLKKRKPVSPERAEQIRRYVNDECKAAFIIWAEGTSLDVGGILDGEPVFRPAICAWEAWKAAWLHLSFNK